MDTFLRIDINIMALVMLIMVYLLAYTHLEKQDSLNHTFLRIALIVIHLLTLETTTCIINNRPELWLIPIASLLHILLFTLAPVSTCYWYFLLRKLIFPKEVLTKKKLLLFFIPVVANGILTVMSPIFHFVFYIDGSNAYHRGSLYFIAAIITYFYIIYGLIYIIVFNKKLVKQDASLLIIFIGFPIAGALIQTFVYGALLIWSCTAFSLVLAYIFLQQRMVHLDELTGAWDRGSFDYYITQRLTQNFEKFGVIYVDIDHLKEINDNFGHMEGDYAIKTAVNIIRNELHKNDIVVRLGGDEFLVIIDCDNSEELINMIARIETAFMLHNKNSNKNYRLECSFGADIFDANFSSIEQFINHVDNLMYKNKNMKRSIK